MSQPILIGFADALAAIESAWSLRDDGFEVVAFARRGLRPALSRVAGVRILDITPPEQDAAQAVADLAAAILKVHPSVVLPLDDQAVWLCDQVFKELSPPGREESSAPKLAGPVGKSAILALDKVQQLVAATAVGFAVPASRNAVTEEPPGRGPWMVKPALAVELRAGRLHRAGGGAASTPGLVREVAKSIGGSAIVQPLIVGTGEGIFGLATPNGVLALSAHRRIRMMNPRGSGSSACRSIAVAPDLVGPVRDFIAHSGLLGLFMIELLRDESGQAWFMELNGRAWGSMALACRRGFAYPAWAVRAALSTRFTPTEPVGGPHVTARHLGREIIHVGAVLTRGGAPRLGTLRNVLTIRRDDRWYNWRPDQAGVLAADTLTTVRGQLRRGRSS
jgi:predicted ATP-grasp superfamily ATP-dependent carboligase